MCTNLNQWLVVTKWQKIPDTIVHLLIIFNKKKPSVIIVITRDSDSCNPGSNPGGTLLQWWHCINDTVHWCYYALYGAIRCHTEFSRQLDDNIQSSHSTYCDTSRCFNYIYSIKSLLWHMLISDIIDTTISLSLHLRYSPHLLPKQHLLLLDFCSNFLTHNFTALNYKLSLFLDL